MDRSSARWPGILAVLGSRFVCLALILGIASPAPSAERVMRWLGMGDRAVEDGQYDLARVQYTRALNALPAGSAVVYDRLASVSLASQEHALAQVYLYAAAARDGWTPRRSEQLRSILDHGEPSALSSALEYASMDLAADDPHLLRHLAQQQIDHLAWDQLEVTLRQWMALEPANGNALYWWGLYLAPEDFIAASEALTRAAADSEWSARALYARDALAGYGVQPLTDAHARLGVALAGLGEWAFAERALTLAVEVNSLNPTALAYLGLARDQQGRDGGPSIQAALALSPNDPVLHYLEGYHWRQAGDDRAAADSFKQAYWLDPANPAPAVEVALTLQRMGALDEAARWYELAVSLAPENLQWVRLLAAFYADTGYALDGAGLVFIEEAAAHTTEDIDLQVSLGWAYYQMQRYDRAREVLSAAVAAGPSDSRAWYYWGVLLEHGGDLRAARTAYESALEASSQDSMFGLLATRAIEHLNGVSP